MYRAKVEQISGINVRAGGKWLKRIGNKNFRVGDYVWTDGRCVYGYDKESMTPFVPQMPKEDIGIPIFTLNPINFYVYLPLNGKLIDYGYKKTGNALLMINDYKKSVYYVSSTKIIAVNIDKNSNKFKMIFSETLTQFGNLAASGTVTLIKNNSTFLTVNLLDLTSSAINDAKKFLEQELANGPFVQEGEMVRVFHICHFNQYVNEQNDPGYTRTWQNQSVYELFSKSRWASNFLNSNADILWGFIENEEKWCFVVRIFVETNSDTIKQPSLSDPITIQGELGYRLELLSGGVGSEISRTYLINESGNYLLDSHEYHMSWVEQRQIISQTTIIVGKTNYGTYNVSADGYSSEPLNTSDVYSSGNGLSKKFYIQDGYYFIINSLLRPNFWDASIYSSNDELILHGVFRAYTYITVYRIKAHKYLIGIKEPDTLKPEEKNYYTNGLYLCSKKNEEIDIKKIIDYGIIFNQRLRPMKKFKNWFERFRKI